jgi:hypothetical protein
MFSLFQDDANTVASNSDHIPPNDKLLTLTSSSVDTRFVFQGVNDSKLPAPPPKQQQDAWCKQVLQLKKNHPPAPPNTTTTIARRMPFQQFHSSRKILQPPQAVTTLVPEENPPQAVDLLEVRQVRFLGSSDIVPDSFNAREIVSKNKENKRRVYWTRNEVSSMKRDALHCARAFRTEQPATVRRLKQLFEDFCWKQSSDNDYSADDEEAEEMLHRFLIDWGMSNVRGLEERVVPRKVFDQDRRMALESVLAYQQILRESGVHSQTEMETMLSTRSESASRRARMFAMYMALGDALAVASFRSDEVCSDDDTPSFA